MSRRPWMPMWWGDYFGDTKHLSTVQHGCYLQLIGHYWLHGKLPDDDRALATIVGMRVDTWRRWHREAIRHFFEDGWRHKRIEEELAKLSEYSEIQSSRANRRWRKTDATASPRHMPLHPHSEEERKEDAEAVASAVPAQPPAPVYTDSKHELWGEGVPILISLGLSEGRARQMIGTWRKHTHDDAQAVLSAIQRARDHRIADPIPWITAALKPHQENNHARRREKPTIMGAAARIAAHIEAGGSVDPTTWIDVPRPPEGPSPLRAGAGNGVAQLLPPKRH